MFKLNNVGKKLYFSVLAVFLVFAVSFIVFQQTREKQYKISTLTLKLANYNELLAEDLELSKTGGILLSDSVEVVDSVRVAEAKLEDFVQTHESKDLRVTLVKNGFQISLNTGYRGFEFVSDILGKLALQDILLLTRCLYALIHLDDSLSNLTQLIIREFSQILHLQALIMIRLISKDTEFGYILRQSVCKTV